MLGSCSRIATHLDAEMLRSRTVIDPIGTDTGSLRRVRDLVTELGGRLLLRYLLPEQVGELTRGTARPQCVTPTPYAPGETISWLGLPPASGPRTWVLLLDSHYLDDVRGPRWIQFGGGIEYVLPHGFSAEAVADVAPGPRGSARWELEVR